jgi:hypothetical protein
MELVVKVDIKDYMIYATFTFHGDKGSIVKRDYDESVCIARRRRKFADMFIGKDIETMKENRDV